jgi:EmrB/QacA subfamily drug resistance transporter
VLAAAILASSMGFIDGSVVSVAMPAIRADIGASLAEAQWISNAYALTLSALILTGGAAGDRFGLRQTFVFGIAFFTIASVACSIAPDASVLIAFRALQGIGAAIMVPCSLAIIAKAYPKGERAAAIGIWASASAVTSALGPAIGGLALSLFDDSVWRAIFAINLPLGVVSIFLLLSRVPADRPAGSKQLDIVGAVLATIGFGALAFGLTGLGEGAGGAIPAKQLIGVGLAAIICFIVWEARAREPMVDLSLFANVAFAGANIATFFLYFSLSAILFFLPMALIAGWGVSPAETGLLFLPLSVLIALLSGPVGKWAGRVGEKWPISVGCLIVGVAFAGLGAMTHAGWHSFWGNAFPSMVVMGLGMALVVSPLSSVVMTVVDDARTGSASGINNAVSRVAGLIAVAAMGAVASWAYSASLGPVALSMPEFGAIAPERLGSADESARIMASDAAFAAIAYISAGLCLLAALVSLVTIPGALAQSENRLE